MTRAQRRWQLQLGHKVPETNSLESDSDWEDDGSESSEEDDSSMEEAIFAAEMKNEARKLLYAQRMDFKQMEKEEKK